MRPLLKMKGHLLVGADALTDSPSAGVGSGQTGHGE
jgi:hypothetical protein